MRPGGTAVLASPKLWIVSAKCTDAVENDGELNGCGDKRYLQ